MRMFRLKEGALPYVERDIYLSPGTNPVTDVPVIRSVDLQLLILS